MAYAPIDPMAEHDAHHVFGGLVNVMHHAAAQPRLDAQQKAALLKALAAMGSEQARAHQSLQQSSPVPGGPGGVQAPEDNGYPSGYMAGLTPPLALVGSHAVGPLPESHMANTGRHLAALLGY